MAKNSGFDLGGIGGGAAIDPGTLEALIGQMLGTDPLVSMDPKEAKAQVEAELRKIMGLTKQIKEDAARRVNGRAKAAIEALLILAGMTGRFCDIKVLGVDAFELVVDGGLETSLGELNLIGRTFQTSAIEVSSEWRSSEDGPGAVREPCSICSDYHEGEVPYWSGDRVVIAVRGVGIDLQNPPV